MDERERYFEQGLLGFGLLPNPGSLRIDIMKFEGKWLELENIILSEEIQTQKDKHASDEFGRILIAGKIRDRKWDEYYPILSL
ncbi:hypothetical protein STEG23_016969 [Scotinomys teguina]